jgi:WD40 repeat protein
VFFVCFLLIASRLNAAVEILPGIDSEVYTASYSRDGRYVVSGGTGKTVKIWDSKNGRLMKTLYGHESIVSSASYRHDGGRIVSASGDNTVKIWDAYTGKEMLTLKGHTNWVWQAYFSPDGKKIVSASADRTVRVWDADSGKELLRIPAHDAPVRCVTYSPSGKRIASASVDGVVKLWDGETGAEIRSFEGKAGAVWALAYSPDAKFIVSGGEDGIVRIWDTGNGNLVRLLKQDGGAVYALAYSPDGSRLAAGAADTVIRTWDAKSFYASRSFKGHGAAVGALDFSPDSRCLLSGSFDTFIKIWHFSDGVERLSFGGNSLDVMSASWSPDSKRIVSAGKNGLITVWDAERMRQLLTLSGHSGDVTQVAYSKDGRLILSASTGKTIKIWDASTGRDLQTLQGHTEAVTAAVFSPDATRIASASNDKTLKIWNIETEKTVFTITLNDVVNCAAYSPDGRFVVTGAGVSVMIWDARTKREPVVLNGHRDLVRSVAYSMDGSRIISASSDETVKIWDAAAGKELLTFRGHSNEVLSAAFSPDGKRAASGDKNFIVKEWDTKTGRELHTGGSLTGEVYTVSYSPDGKRLLAGSGGGVLKAWDSVTGMETALLSRYANGEWVCVNPSGFYNSSPSGAENIMLRIKNADKNDTYNLERFRPLLYRPTPQSVWVDIPEDNEAALENAVLFSPPELAISSPQNGSGTMERSTQLSFSTSYQNAPVERIRVLLNGRLIASNDNSAFSSSRQLKRETREIVINNEGAYREYNFPVTLNAGGNFIEAYASNRFAEGKDSVEVEWNNVPLNEKRQLPDLWVFSIGVGAYNDPDIPNLEWTPLDARDIISVFKRQQGRLYRKVNSVLIADKMSILPTLKSISARLNYFKQMSPQDTAVFYLAGRGFTDAAGDFYFLPKDAAYKKDGTIDISKAISRQKLFAMLDLPCQKIILLDLYGAEGIDGRESLCVDYNMLVRDIQRDNAVIISSCGGIETAQTISKSKRGVFTYALTQGLKGGADSLKDNVIGIDELKTYLSETIPKLTSSMQHPIASIPDSFLFFKAARLR